MPPDPTTTVEMTDALLDAALGHVTFDGWGEAAFHAAADESGIDRALARVICPRGALDLAVAYHRRGDRAMAAALASENVQKHLDGKEPRKVIVIKGRLVNIVV